MSWYIGVADAVTAICRKIDGSLEIWPETAELIENVQVLSGRDLITSLMHYKWISWNFRRQYW